MSILLCSICVETTTFPSTLDLYDPELPLVKSKAYGGTMVLWKLCHDPFITVHHLTSSSFLPVIFSPPGSPVSVHVSIYLPTHGQDSRFMEDLSSLIVCQKLHFSFEVILMLAIGTSRELIFSVTSVMNLTLARLHYSTRLITIFKEFA